LGLGDPPGFENGRRDYVFGKGIKLFTIFGFEVRIDASWLLLAVLVILSLAMGYFPVKYTDLSKSAYVLMGVVGALGLFASIVVHELCHSLVARWYGTPMKGITLFIFGGVAQMGEESRTPKAEFVMAIAGPMASFVLAGVFYVLYSGAQGAEASTATTGILGYLAWINFILALFNLLPAFPLDGGRVLRSALWAWKKNMRWATRIASRIGGGFGVGLIVLGVISLLTGNLVGGLWWALIGMFLRSVAGSSYRQLVIQEALSGEKVERFMKENPISVSKDLTVKRLVDDYIYQHHFKMFPVVTDGRLEGCVSTREVKRLPRSEWETTTVGDIEASCSDQNTIDPQAEATEALAVMGRTGNTRLVVARDGQLKGVVVLKDLLEFLTVKLEIEDAAARGK
jgi:Zn-dependent protease